MVFHEATGILVILVENSSAEYPKGRDEPFVLQAERYIVIKRDTGYMGPVAMLIACILAWQEALRVPTKGASSGTP